MATATVPRSDVYLSLLAGRAVTALADLSSDSAAWNARVENGLRDGIVYCQAVRLREEIVPSGKSSDGWNPLKRSVENAPDTGTPSADACAESEKIEDLLSRIVSREHRPQLPELVWAIEFFRKTATDR